MGYDIVTIEADAAKAQKFAAKYNYTYLFDKETGEWSGGDEVYFRANIWGMSIIRGTQYSLCYVTNMTDADTEDWMEAMSWNDGRIIDSAKIARFLDKIDELSRGQDLESYVRPVVTQAVTDSWDDKYDGQINTMVDGKFVTKRYTIEDKVNDCMPLVLEWLDYIRIAKDLGGFQVW